jgi:acylphosphatase
MLGITGRAWNLADGRVEVHCEGTQVARSQSGMLSTCHAPDWPDSDAGDGTGRHS